MISNFQDLLFLFVWFFETASHSIAQVGLKVQIFLSLPPECWDYNHVPLHPSPKFGLKNSIYSFHLAFSLGNPERIGKTSSYPEATIQGD
jgi:hypothetical protein